MKADTCPTCGTSLPERAIYCPSCAKQARCKACRDILEPNARACVSCGTLLGSGDTTIQGSIASTPNPAINTIEFQETTKGRSLRASLTDIAVGNLSESFGLFMSGRITTGGRNNRTTFPNTTIVEQRQLALTDLPTEVANSDQDQQVVQLDPSEVTVSASDADKLRRIFRPEGDSLRLIETRLKATSKLDATRRVVYLFLYANELRGRDKVLRSEVNEVLKKAALYDNNASTWIGKSPDLSIDGDMVSLLLPGEEQARKILEEVLNPDIPNEWSFGSARASRSIKNDGGSGGASSSNRQRSAGTSKTVASWVVAWKELGLPVDGHAVLKDRTRADKGIFGLWAIRRAVGDAGKIVSRLNLSRFLYEAFELKVEERGLGQALESDAVKGKVLKVTGGYQIQPPGVNYAQQMAGISQAMVVGPLSNEAFEDQP